MRNLWDTRVAEGISKKYYYNFSKLLFIIKKVYFNLILE